MPNAKPTEPAKPQLEAFHFPGSGQYRPMTIEAPDRAAAEKLWEKERQEA